MRQILIILLGTVIILCLVFHCGHREQKYIPGEVLIKFTANTDSVEIDSLCKAMGLLKVKDIEQINVTLYKINSQMKVNELIESYKDNPHIEYIEPNYTINLNK